MCCSIYSSRIIQKLLESTQDTEKRNYFLTVIISNLMKIANDCNGLHVIMKVIEIFKNDRSIPKGFNYNNLIDESDNINNKLSLKYIYSRIILELKSLCCDKYGCCFIQKIFKSTDQEFKSYLVNIIMRDYFEEFINHQYANYVLQEIISFKDSNINSYVLKYVSKDILSFSKNKATSNIIEILLKEWSQETIKVVMQYIEHNPNFIRELVLNNYGNYGKIIIY